MVGDFVGAILNGDLVGFFVGAILNGVLVGDFVGDFVVGSGFVTIGALVGSRVGVLENGD